MITFIIYSYRHIVYVSKVNLNVLQYFKGSDDEDYAQKAPLPPESPMPPPLPPTPDQVIVRKDYDPKGWYSHNSIAAMLSYNAMCLAIMVSFCFS